MEQALKWVILVLAVGVWCVTLFISLRALKLFRFFVTQMKQYRDRCFPEDMLHPRLSKKSDSSTQKEILYVKRNDSDWLRLPDVEEEKYYPYYNQTGQIICDAQKYDRQALEQHTWFGYAEWVQSWICGQSGAFLFHKQSFREGRENER